MKPIFLALFMTLSIFGMSQQKGKIIPIDKSILKLSEDTVERPELYKKIQDFDYVIVTNKETNKKDTIMVYRDLFVDKKRKPKN